MISRRPAAALTVLTLEVVSAAPLEQCSGALSWRTQKGNRLCLAPKINAFAVHLLAFKSSPPLGRSPWQSVFMREVAISYLTGLGAFTRQLIQAHAWEGLQVH